MSKGTTRTSGRKTLTKAQVLKMQAEGSLKRSRFLSPDDPVYSNGFVVGGGRLSDIVKTSSKTPKRSKVETIPTGESA